MQYCFLLSELVYKILESKNQLIIPDGLCRTPMSIWLSELWSPGTIPNIILDKLKCSKFECSNFILYVLLKKSPAKENMRSASQDWFSVLKNSLTIWFTFRSIKILNSLVLAAQWQAETVLKLSTKQYEAWTQIFCFQYGYTRKLRFNNQIFTIIIEKAMDYLIVIVIECFFSRLPISGFICINSM